MMIKVDLTKNSENHTEPIMDDKVDNFESQILDSSSLKIQNLNLEIVEVSKKQERHRIKTLKRLVGKNGSNRRRTVGLKRMRKEKLKDGFTTFLEWSWFSTLFIFSASYFFSWLFFAFFWHLILWLHGDLDPTQFHADSNYVPCVFGIEDFTSSFLFSMETQTSIGYGLRVSSHKCPDAVILQCVQTVIGILLDATVIGLFFVKVSRPGRRAITVVFSKNAVITKRNGLLRLIFQVANIQTSQLIEAHLRGQVLVKEITEEGEVINHLQREIKVSSQIDKENEVGEDRGLFLLPIQVSHTIDSDSPLYSMTPAYLLASKMEFIFSMEAVVEPSGNTTQAITSFLCDEILWGCRFDSCVEWDEGEGLFKVDVGRINQVARDHTPWISAKELGNISGVSV